jgi:hypothetical protein
MELLLGVLCMLLASGPIAAARLPDGISHRVASLTEDDQRGLRLRGAKHPTYSGYFSVDDDDSELFYAYWEAQNPEAVVRDAPIILWLQVGDLQRQRACRCA